MGAELEPRPSWQRTFAPSPRFTSPSSSPASQGAPYPLPAGLQTLRIGGTSSRRRICKRMEPAAGACCRSHPPAEAARKFARVLAHSRHSPAREAALLVPPAAADPEAAHGGAAAPAGIRRPWTAPCAPRAGSPRPARPAERRWVFTAARGPLSPPAALRAPDIIHSLTPSPAHSISKQ